MIPAALTDRRTALIDCCEQLGVPLNPTHDGFFAWLDHEQPHDIAEACAQQDVYLVPLTGGVRIGLCAIPLAQIPNVASALRDALQ